MNMDQSLSQELDTLKTQVHRLRPGHKSDLQKMLSRCQYLWAEMSKEHVRCRRVWKLTPKYLDLEQELKDTLKVAQQYVVFATLMQG